MTVSSYSDTTLTLQSYSAASREAVSESICWLMVTIMPIAISLWMRSELFRFIFRASSETVIPSVMAISFGTGFAMITVFFFTWRYFSSG